MSTLVASLSPTQVDSILKKADEADVAYAFVVAGKQRSNFHDPIELVFRPEGDNWTDLRISLFPDGKWLAFLHGIPLPWAKENADVK